MLHFRFGGSGFKRLCRFWVLTNADDYRCIVESRLKILGLDFFLVIGIMMMDYITSVSGQFSFSCNGTRTITRESQINNWNYRLSATDKRPTNGKSAYSSTTLVCPPVVCSGVAFLSIVQQLPFCQYSINQNWWSMTLTVFHSWPLFK